MNKRGFFIEIIIVVVLIIVGFFWFTHQSDLENGLDNETLGEAIGGKLEEYVREECVPASCCHATECVLKSEAPSCDEISCTMNCEPNTLDCGYGSCEFVNEKCGVIWNE